MKFSKQTLAVAFFLLAGSALAAEPAPTQEEAKEVAEELKTLGNAIQKELKDCIAAPGENTAECFNRQPGMNLDPSKPMSEAEISAAIPKYSELVGSSLAACIKAKGFYTCLKEIQEADDKATFHFKRGGFSDFWGGFKKGFTGALSVAGPIITSFLPSA